MELTELLQPLNDLFNNNSSLTVALGGFGISLVTFAFFIVRFFIKKKTPTASPPPAISQNNVSGPNVGGNVDTLVSGDQTNVEKSGNNNPEVTNSQGDVHITYNQQYQGVPQPAHPPQTSTESNQPSFPIWNIPFQKNLNFTGRESLLTQLKKDLASGQPMAVTQTIAGLGGIGKTQLCLEYAYRHQKNYDVVWWLRSEFPESLAEDYVQLASHLKLPEAKIPEQKVVVEAVRNWLEHNFKWLLIFDNVEVSLVLKNYLLRLKTGHTLNHHMESSQLGTSSKIGGN